MNRQWSQSYKRQSDRRIQNSNTTSDGSMHKPGGFGWGGRGHIPTFDHWSDDNKNNNYYNVASAVGQGHGRSIGVSSPSSSYGGRYEGSSGQRWEISRERSQWTSYGSQNTASYYVSGQQREISRTSNLGRGVDSFGRAQSANANFWPHSSTPTNGGQFERRQNEGFVATTTSNAGYNRWSNSSTMNPSKAHGRGRARGCMPYNYAAAVKSRGRGGH